MVLFIGIEVHHGCVLSRRNYSSIFNSIIWLIVIDGAFISIVSWQLQKECWRGVFIHCDPWTANKCICILCKFYAGLNEKQTEPLNMWCRTSQKKLFCGVRQYANLGNSTKIQQMFAQFQAKTHFCISLFLSDSSLDVCLHRNSRSLETDVVNMPVQGLALCWFCDETTHAIQYAININSGGYCHIRSFRCYFCHMLKQWYCVNNLHAVDKCLMFWCASCNSGLHNFFSCFPLQVWWVQLEIWCSQTLQTWHYLTFLSMEDIWCCKWGILA